MPIINSLKRHRTLLSEVKITATTAEVQALRRDFEKYWKKLQEIDDESKDKELDRLKEGFAQKRDKLKSQFAGGDYESDQRQAFSQCLCTTPNDWILEDTRYKSWLRPVARSSGVLYLHGMPGAGEFDCTVKFAYWCN